ncbi:MAG TPA: apolipoprotein N-acyltransferase [Prosthecobacter sp.]
MTSVSRLVRLLLPLLSGGLLTLAYPGWNLEIMAWVWLLPLLAVLWPVTRGGADAGARSFFWPGFWAGLAFWIPNLGWLRHSSRVIAGARGNEWMGLGTELMGAGAVVGLALYCSLYFGLWSWFVARFARPDRKVLSNSTWQASTFHSLACSFKAAAAWAGLEWLRGWLFTGFGWNGLGVALHQNSALIQITDVVGVTGLSFLPVLVACTAWNALSRMVAVYHGEGQCRSRLDFTVAVTVLLAVAGYGMMKLTRQAQGEQVVVRTVLVQPNVAQVDAWSGQFGARVYERLANFTRLYAEAREGVTHTDLVIWPESALPVHLYGIPNPESGLPNNPDYLDHLLGLGDYSLLTGTEVYSGVPGDGHVSAVLFKSNFDNRQQYDKMHLVPFGEYLPFRNIPPFSFLQGVLPGDFKEGESAEPLKLEKPQAQIIPLICFEDTVGRLARRFVREAPQMIVNITNDGWFLESIETQVHLANARFRAIELRRPMVRAANTGVTCFIDTFGRITSQLNDPETGNTFIEGCLPGEVKIPAVPEMTFYARHGDAFSVSLLAVAALSGLLQGLKPRRSREKTA